MPFFKITYNATLNEDIAFTVEADSRETAIQSADTIAWDILTGSTFVHEAMNIELQDISQEPPVYVPLTTPPEQNSSQDNQGYTSLASVYSGNRNPALSEQNSCEEVCCDETPSYTRLT